MPGLCVPRMCHGWCKHQGMFSLPMCPSVGVWSHQGRWAWPLTRLCSFARLFFPWPGRLVAENKGILSGQAVLQHLAPCPASAPGASEGSGSSLALWLFPLLFVAFGQARKGLPCCFSLQRCCVRDRFWQCSCGSFTESVCVCRGSVPPSHPVLAGVALWGRGAHGVLG